MISINLEKKQLTLKAIFKDQEIINDLIIKKNGANTLISEENTIYLFFNEIPSCFSLRKIILNFIRGNVYSLNVDMDSFKVTKGCVEKTIINAFLYGSHKELKIVKKECTKTEEYNLISTKADVKKLFEELQNINYYVNFARDLQDMPPNILHSVRMAEIIEEEAKKHENIKIKVLNKKEIEENKMGLLLSVNAGSNHEPRVVILEYNGNPQSEEKIGFIGKGITFDTGGYNLKPSQFISDMKFDMSGAAIMLSSVMAIAKSNLKANIVAIGCLTDNRIGLSATLPESIITSMSGKTVQIDNTDAEGRLVLADGITYAIQKYSVNKIIEASTLTGATKIALSSYMTAVFSNNEEFYKNFSQANSNTHEEIWRMPIHEENFAALKKTPIADISNIGKDRYGGASIAAAFLCEFVEDKPFIHLDIAGTADVSSRGTGVMVHTLYNLFK